jgi:transcription initiation factor TFIID subunit 1
MKKRAKARELEREAAGGGDIFFMRKPEDISGQDGEIVLFEYMEEHPPLLSLVGMCSKVHFILSFITWVEI